MRLAFFQILFAVFAAAFLGVTSAAADVRVEGAASVDFNDTIRPLFNRHCVGCHGGVKKAGGISFLSRASATGEAKSGDRAIVPGEPEASALLSRVTTDDPDERMPPPEHGPALTAQEVSALQEWIQEGAPWKTHWAFEPPVSGRPPEVASED